MEPAPEIVPIPPGERRVRKDSAWYAGPLFIVGLFLAVHIGVGLRMQPSLKALAGGAGLALVVASARGIAHPLPTALFWGGLFLGWTFRAAGVWGPAFGLAVAFAGGLLYVLRARPRPGAARIP
jgi:hypothetical protein